MKAKKVLEFILDYPRYSLIIALALIFIVKNSFTYNTGVNLEKNDYNVPRLKKEKMDFTKETIIDSTFFKSLSFNGKYDSFKRKTGYWIEADIGIDSTIKGSKLYFGRSFSDAAFVDTMGARQYIILGEGTYKHGKKDGTWLIYKQTSLLDNKWIMIFNITFSEGDTIKKVDFRNPLTNSNKKVPLFTYPSNTSFEDEREKVFSRMNSQKKY